MRTEKVKLLTSIRLLSRDDGGGGVARGHFQLFVCSHFVRVARYFLINNFDQKSYSHFGL